MKMTESEASYFDNNIASHFLYNFHDTLLQVLDYVQKKGWMDGELMKWIRQIWIKYTQKLFWLLLVDLLRVHCTEDIQDLLAAANSEVAFIPGGCTSKFQPLDASPNKPFRVICRKLSSSFCRSQLANMRDPTDRLKKTASLCSVVAIPKDADC